MLQQSPSNFNWLLPFIGPLISVIFGVILGIAAEFILFIISRRLVSNSPWRGTEIVVRSLRFIPFLWFTVLGLFIGTLGLPFEENFIRLSQNALFIILTLSLVFVLARVSIGLAKLYLVREKTQFVATSITTSLIYSFFLLFGSFNHYTNSRH